MLEDLLALVGVVLGFVLSELSQARKERRRTALQVRGVRLLLQQEIFLNLRRLEELWRAVEAEPSRDVSKNYDAVALRHAKRLLETPISGFSRASLTSQLGNLPEALSEKEIASILEFHDDLDSLTTIRSALGRASTEQYEIWMKATEGTGVVSGASFMASPRPLDTLAPKVWPECQQIVERLRKGAGLLTDAA